MSVGQVNVSWHLLTTDFLPGNAVIGERSSFHQNTPGSTSRHHALTQCTQPSDFPFGCLPCHTNTIAPHGILHTSLSVTAKHQQFTNSTTSIAQGRKNNPLHCQHVRQLTWNNLNSPRLLARRTCFLSCLAHALTLLPTISLSLSNSAE